MKKTKKCLLLLCGIAMLAAVGTMAACKDEETSNSSSPDSSASFTQDVETYIEINPMKLSLDVYEREQLSASIRRGSQYVFEAVTWRSVNPSIASVTSEGIVEAVSRGTTQIIASYGEHETACEVTVTESGAKANLALTDYSVDMRVGENKRVSPIVRFKGMSYTDADFTYTVEDESVATISRTGVITALSYGVTNVTVSASWRGLQGEKASLLTKEFTLNVIDAIYATITDNDYVVYQNDTEIEGVKFSNTADLEYSLRWAETDIPTDDAALQWYSTDENVLNVKNGKLYGVKAGEAEVYCAYTSEKGDVYESNRVNVLVIFPVLDKSESMAFTIDKNTVLTGEEVFGKAVDIEYIECDGVSVSTQNPGAIDFEKMENGAHVITVYNADYGYKVDAYVCTQVIRTLSDLLTLQYKGTNIGGGNLYALGNDIDGEGATIPTASYGWNQNTGFQGEIDGRGYTISNITVGSYGIFGTLGKAKIHDLNFTEITLRGTWRTALLAATCYNTTLENITVSFKEIGIPQKDGLIDECGLLVARATTTAVTMRNVTLNAEGLVVPCVFGYEVGEITLVNIVVNAKEVKFLGSSQQWAADASELELFTGVTINEGVEKNS